MSIILYKAMSECDNRKQYYPLTDLKHRYIFETKTRWKRLDELNVQEEIQEVHVSKTR